MSAHYTFMLSIPLAPELASAHSDVLDFVFNGGTLKPASYPEHEFFRIFRPNDRFHNSYRHFPSGAWSSIFWQDTPDKGICRSAGVQLCLPSIKLEELAQDLFPLTSWLASLSIAYGAVGMAFAEDLPDTEPFVFYVREKRLYVGSANTSEAYALEDGSAFIAQS
jgi:hypothetical protein